MARYVCTVCGFIYDEEKGLEESGINPGTLWSDVPDDFICPTCGASKDMFEQE